LLKAGPGSNVDSVGNEELRGVEPEVDPMATPSGLWGLRVVNSGMHAPEERQEIKHATPSAIFFGFIIGMAWVW
jgi:hypothetical protein